jgi:hypothetical protein
MSLLYNIIIICQGLNKNRELVLCFILVPPTGVEPVTSGLKGRYSAN